MELEVEMVVLETVVETVGKVEEEELDPGPPT